MPADLDPSDSSDVQPKRRLKLVMPSDPQQISSPASAPDQNLHVKESSGTPPRPSYSPVTPTLSQTSPAQPEAGSADQWIDEPEALPVSLDDNPDAVAVRAAISILQMQRQQSQRDIRDLDMMKRAALQDPETFVNDLKDGKLSSEPRTGVDVDNDEYFNRDQNLQDRSALSQFGKFPTAQNVVRAPPIEWSKYHIVGEPLDRLHEIQRRYPGLTEEMLDSVGLPQPHTIAAPYRAFSDKLDEPHMPVWNREA